MPALCAQTGKVPGIPGRGFAIDGRVVDEDGFNEHPARRGIGMVFQNPELWPHLTVQDHIRFVLHGLLKAEQKKRVDALLAMTDLVSLKERYPGEISGGQARRTALARALAGNPRCHLKLFQGSVNKKTFSNPKNQMLRSFLR